MLLAGSVLTVGRCLLASAHTLHPLHRCFRCSPTPSTFAYFPLASNGRCKQRSSAYTLHPLHRCFRCSPTPSTLSSFPLDASPACGVCQARTLPHQLSAQRPEELMSDVQMFAMHTQKIHPRSQVLCPLSCCDTSATLSGRSCPCLTLFIRHP